VRRNRSRGGGERVPGVAPYAFCPTAERPEVLVFAAPEA
jgi:hypothetical protein